jgi:PadR family transcriptional regulator, regulatory protein AphA
MLTTTEAALLGLLRHCPMSGYDLRKEVEKSVGYFWAPAKTQIYATLPKLVESGYATHEKVVQDARPDKTIYSITEGGLEALRDWVENAPLDAGQGRNLILLKVYFGSATDTETLLQQVRERRQDAEQLRAELEELDAIPGARDDPFQTLTRRWGFEYAEALIRWTEEAERVLRRATRGARATG